MLAKVLDGIAALDTLPLRGAVPKDMAGTGGRGFRQFVYGPDRVVYQVKGDRVTVVLVADGRRDMQALMGERLLGGWAARLAIERRRVPLTITIFVN